MGETERLTVEAITELQKYKEKYDSIAKVVDNYTLSVLDEEETIVKIRAIMGVDFSAGDICRYKGYTDRFMITYINPDGKTFDGVYPDGSVVNDGSLNLIERVGHYKLEDFLNLIREDKDNE